MSISPIARSTTFRRGRGSVSFWSGGSGLDLSSAGELLGEIGHRLGIDPRRIPLQQHLEIGGAFAPWLMRLPAVALQIIGGRGEHVGYAADQIAPAAAVIIDGVFEIGRRQELRLADLAGPGAA